MSDNGSANQRKARLAIELRRSQVLDDVEAATEALRRYQYRLALFARLIASGVAVALIGGALLAWSVNPFTVVVFILGVIAAGASSVLLVGYVAANENTSSTYDGHHVIRHPRDKLRQAHRALNEFTAELTEGHE